MTQLDGSQRYRRKAAVYAGIFGTTLFALAGGIAFILEMNYRKNMPECQNFDFNAACEALMNNATAVINETGCALSDVTDWCGKNADAVYEHGVGIGLCVASGIWGALSPLVACSNSASA